MIKQVLLLRGLPGSGKSTFANFISSITDSNISICICNADSFLYENNEYIYTKERSIIAHLQCKKQAEEAMQNNINVIIIDNTNINADQYRYYKKLAQIYNYNFRTIILENILGTSSIHNVNKDIISNMRKAFSINL